MTITTLYGPVGYTGNGVTTTFAIPWPFTAAVDVQAALWDTVNLVNVLCTLNGTGTGGYSVTGTQDSVTGLYTSGTVTFAVAPLSTFLVEFGRYVQPLQPAVFVPNGPVPMGTLGGALDRLTMIAQQNAPGIYANSETAGYATINGGLENWGTGTLVNGVCAVTWQSPFVDGLSAVSVTPSGITNAGAAPALGYGNASKTGMTVYGPVGSNATFSYRARGW